MLDLRESDAGILYDNVQLTAATSAGSPHVHSYVFQFGAEPNEDGSVQARVMVRMGGRNWLDWKECSSMDEAVEFLNEVAELIEAGEYNDKLDMFAECG